MCIYDDQDRLRNAAAWPDSITISEWFLSQKQKMEEMQQTRGDVSAVLRVLVVCVQHSHCQLPRNRCLVLLFLSVTFLCIM